MLIALLAVAALGALSAPALAAGVASVAPSDLSFSNAASDPPSEAQTVTLTNTGPDALKVTAGADIVNAHFNLIDDLCKNKTFLAGESCSVSVNFDATDAAVVSGSLTIPTDAGNATVVLRGNAPRATVDTTLRTFGSPVGSTSASKQIFLTNTGDAPLSTTEIPFIVGSNFTVRSTTCSTTAALLPGATCAVDVAFSAPSAAVYTAALRFTTDDPVTKTIDVPLSGLGGVADPGPGGGQNPSPNPTLPDGDSDGIPDSLDLCPITAGDLKNGCPSELNASITGRWRTNTLLTQLVSLTVNAATGSKIELRCTNSRGRCGFTKRTIQRTTRRLTSLTKLFKGKRILRAGTTITVRVSRPQQTGTYKRMQTRTRRRLPKVSEGCLSARTGAVTPCT